jgi:hypothetical protein
MKKLFAISLFISFACLVGSNVRAQIPTTNLKLHVKADAGVTQSGGLVSGWADQSGNGNNMTQGIESRKPAVVSNVFGSNPAIRFDNDYLILPSAATLGIQNNEYEIFIVAKTTNNNSNLMFLMGGASVEQFEAHYNGSAGIRFIPRTSLYIDNGAIGTYSNASAQLFNFRASASEGLVQMNGTDSTRSAFDARSAFAGDIYLGIRGDLSWAYTGDIAEVIIYNAVLSESDRTSVETYLNNKYWPPILTTINSSDIESNSSTSFQFNSIVSTSQTTSYRVNYGTNPDSLINSTSFVDGTSGASTDTLAIEVTGLDSNKVYFAQLEADASGNQTFSDIIAIHVGSPVFTKDSLQLWMAADYSLPYYGNNPVSTWYDLTGQARNATQTNGTRQPTYTEDVLNGLPVIRFDGSSDAMVLPSSSTMGIQSSDYEILVLIKAEEKQYSAIIGNNYTQPTPYVKFSQDDNGLDFIADSDTRLTVGSPSEFYDSNFHLVNVNGTETSGEIRIDGKLFAKAENQNFRNSGNGDFYIGADSEYFRDYLNGDIAEIIIFNRKLSATERLEITQYLSDKYALSLPIGTPTVQASNAQLENNTRNAADLTFTKGNGFRTLVLMKEGSEVDFTPVDGTSYETSSVFGGSTELGTGNYAILADTSTSIRVTGLTAGETYFVKLFSFNGDSGTEKYLTTAPDTASVEIEVTTFITQISPNQFSVNVPVSSDIAITFSDAIQTSSITADSTFTVWGSLSGKKSGSFSFSNSDKTVTFNPTTDFIPGELVTVSLSKDIAGVNSTFSDARSLTYHVATSAGSGQFAESFTANFPSNSTAMQLVDLNADSRTDILITNSSNNLYVYVNNGDSSYSRTDYSINDYIYTIQAADFNNDNAIDLAIAGQDSLIIYQNDGSGGLEWGMSFGLEYDAYLIKASDVTNDGFVDIIVYVEYYIQVFENNSGLGFTNTQNYYTDYSYDEYLGMVLHDMDGDGLLDLIISEGDYDEQYWLKNNGDATFGSKTMLNSLDATTQVIAADIDGDYDRDLVFGAYDNNFFVSKAVNNVFQAATTYDTNDYAEIIRLLDLDGDGDLDIFSMESSRVELWVNNGSGSFTRSKTVDLDNYFDFIEIADMNQDGSLDLVTVSSDVVRVYTQSVNVPLNISGVEGWRILASPIGTVSYSSFLEDFWTQGLEGADTQSGASNVYYWDNSTDHDSVTNWKSVNSLHDNLYTASGALVYLFSDDNGPQEAGDAGFPKSFDYSGIEFSSDIGVDSLLNQNENGLTLLGNPYAYGLDWDNISKGSLSSTVYVWDNDSLNWKSWNGSVGSLTDGIIPALSGFFVQSTSSSPSLYIYRSAIVGGPEGDNEEKALPKNQTALNLTLSFGDELSNRAWIEWSADGELGKDLKDGLKFKSLTNDYIQISTVSEDNLLLDINHLPLAVSEFEIPVQVQSTRSGKHTISLDRFTIPTEWNVTLIDHKLGLETDLKQSYSFDLQSVAKKEAKDEWVPQMQLNTAEDSRFILKVSGVTTSVEHQQLYQLALEQNYPNPFNPSTSIAFSLAKPAQVSIKVYDLLGRKVAEPVNGVFQAGAYNQQFNAENLASGIYFYSMFVDGVAYQTRKMTLIK